MVDIGHLGPNEHISQGAKKNSHRSRLFIGVKVHRFGQVYDFTKSISNKSYHAYFPLFCNEVVLKCNNFYQIDIWGHFDDVITPILAFLSQFTPKIPLSFNISTMIVH